MTGRNTPSGPLFWLSCGVLNLEEEGKSCRPCGENSRFPCPQSAFIAGLVDIKTVLSSGLLWREALFPEVVI